MRPVAITQNPLRSPLNELLGADAHVRIFRALAANDEPLSVRELSERTEVTQAGIHQALKRLLKTGFVVLVGGSHARRHTLRWTDPLLQSMIELFNAEERRYENLLDGIRGVFYRTSPPPISAWISELPPELGKPVEISLLGEARSLTESLRSLRSALVDLERQFDVTIELQGYTRADLSRIDSVAHIYLAGAPLAHESASKAGGRHRDKDLELIRSSQQVADLIIRDPTLVSRARRHVEQVLTTQQGASRHDLEEWRDILGTYSLNRLRSFLNSASDRAVRLRQSSPFWAVLTEHERARITNQSSAE